MSTETYYRDSASSDACSTVREFMVEIIDQLIDNEEASDDLFNKYPNGDAYHHESHNDMLLTLKEAATILEELSEFEEDDSGLWEGQEPHAAVQTQAAYTYGNAVLSIWRDLIEEINDTYRGNLDTIHDIRAGLETEAELLTTLEEQAKLGALNQVKAATLHTLRNKAAELTPKAIEKAEREAIQMIVEGCLDS